MLTKETLKEAYEAGGMDEFSTEALTENAKDWINEFLNIGAFTDREIETLVNEYCQGFYATAIDEKLYQAIKDINCFAKDHAEDVFEDDNNTWQEEWDDLNKSVQTVTKYLEIVRVQGKYGN